MKTKIQLVRMVLPVVYFLVLIVAAIILGVREDEEKLSLAEILKANGLDKIDTGPRKEDEMADKLVQGINTLFSKFM